jgi:hypothetical protein
MWSPSLVRTPFLNIPLLEIYKISTNQLKIWLPIRYTSKGVVLAAERHSYSILWIAVAGRQIPTGLAKLASWMRQLH